MCTSRHLTSLDMDQSTFSSSQESLVSKMEDKLMNVKLFGQHSLTLDNGHVYQGQPSMNLPNTPTTQVSRDHTPVSQASCRANTVQVNQSEIPDIQAWSNIQCGQMTEIPVIPKSASTILDNVLPSNIKILAIQEPACNTTGKADQSAILSSQQSTVRDIYSSQIPTNQESLYTPTGLMHRSQIPTNQHSVSDTSEQMGQSWMPTKQNALNTTDREMNSQIPSYQESPNTPSHLCHNQVPPGQQSPYTVRWIDSSQTQTHQQLSSSIISKGYHCGLFPNRLSSGISTGQMFRAQSSVHMDVPSAESRHTGARLPSDMNISPSVSQVQTSAASCCLAIPLQSQDLHSNYSLSNFSNLNLVSSSGTTTSNIYTSSSQNIDTRIGRLVTHIQNDCEQLKDRTEDSEMGMSILNSDRCEICDKQFKTHLGLKKHMLFVHCGYTISCKICHKEFSWENRLKRHLLKEHVESNLCGGCGILVDEIVQKTNPDTESCIPSVIPNVTGGFGNGQTDSSSASDNTVANSDTRGDDLVSHLSEGQGQTIDRNVTRQIQCTGEITKEENRPTGFAHDTMLNSNERPENPATLCHLDMITENLTTGVQIRENESSTDCDNEVQNSDKRRNDPATLWCERENRVMDENTPRTVLDAEGDANNMIQAVPNGMLNWQVETGYNETRMQNVNRGKEHLISHIQKHCMRLNGCDGNANNLPEWARNRGTQCEICKKHFRNWNVLKRHVATIHLTQDLTCQICQREFSRKCNLKKHLLKQHVDGNALNTCGGCGQAIYDHVNRESPVNEENNTRDTQEVSGRSGNQNTQDVSVRSKNQPEASFQRPLHIDTREPASESGKEVLITHIKKNCFELKGIDGSGIDLPPWASTDWKQCRICQKRFFKQVNFKRHLNTVHFSYRIKCKICQREFCRKDNLKRHLLNHHVDCNASNTCVGCGQIIGESMNRESPVNEEQNTSDIQGVSVRPENQSEAPFQRPLNNRDTQEVFDRSENHPDVRFQGPLYIDTREPVPETGKEGLITHIKKNCIALKGLDGNGIVFPPWTSSDWQQCRICQKHFLKKVTFKRHLITVHFPYKVECKICQKDFSRKENLKRHLLRNHVDDNSTFRCGGCGMTPDDNPCLSRPPVSKGKSKRKQSKPSAVHEKRPCPVCGKMVARPSQHMVVHSNEFPFKCMICSKLFKTKFEVESHLRYHSSERNFKCEICEKAFKTHSTLLIHMRIHVGKKQNKRCHECFKYYRGSFEIHVERVHKTSGSHIIRCIVCNKAFPNLKTRNQHMNMHTGSRPFKCNTCGKFFTTYASLYAHGLRHADKVPCHECGKRVRKFNMTKHLVTHSDIKAHQCEVCGKRFKHLPNLMTHMVSHSENRRHCCDLCDKRFKLPHQLRAHKKTHRVTSL